jgi:hypothetical protein
VDSCSISIQPAFIARIVALGKPISDDPRWNSSEISAPSKQQGGIAESSAGGDEERQATAPSAKTHSASWRMRRIRLVGCLSVVRIALALDRILGFIAR